MTAALEHWRSVEDQLRPIPDVTAPEDTAMWEEQLWAQSVAINERERAEARYIERVLRRNRQRIIDQLKKENTMTPALRSRLEAVVAELNKPESLAKYRTEAAMGRAYIAGMNKQQAEAYGKAFYAKALAEHKMWARQKVIDQLLKDAQR
jgi:hypothetical protein